MKTVIRLYMSFPEGERLYSVNQLTRRFLPSDDADAHAQHHHQVQAAASASESALLSELRAKLEAATSALNQREEEMLQLHKSLDEANEQVATAGEEVR